MAANRCSTCATNWPTSVAGECPECGQKMSSVWDVSPIDEDEAKVRIAYAGFRRFLDSETDEQRELRRQKFADEEAARFAAQLEGL